MQMRAMLRRVARSHLQPWSRRRKTRQSLALMQRWHVDSVLAVGVYASPDFAMNNQIEMALAGSVDRFVALGLEAEPHAWPAYVAADGRALPFADKAFDLVYANAVIEHVGGKDEQHRFMQEVERVGKHWIVTTPNRWFPVELHSYAVLRHWSSAWRQDRLTPSVTRLLSRSEFRELLPRGKLVARPVPATFTAVSDG